MNPKPWWMLPLALAAGLVGCNTLRRPAPVGVQEIAALDYTVANSLDQRNLWPAFNRYQRYTAGRLNAAAGSKSWKDKTGNCRLSWYDRMMRDQLRVPSELEQFSRELHESLQAENNGLPRALTIAATRLDLKPAAARNATRPKSQADLQAVLVRALTDARHSWDQAVAPLNDAEKLDLLTNLYDVSTRQIAGNSHGFRDEAAGRRLCDLMEKMDRPKLAEAAAALAFLANPPFLDKLKAWPAQKPGAMPGIEGDVLQAIETPAGQIIIGGPGDNVYDLETLTGVAMVIDPGGNDLYREGSVNAQRPVLVLIDLAGDDTYRGEKPGIQGGAVCGISMLLDRRGNDSYDAQDIAQGACVNGIGILVDDEGQDSYRALRRAQGSAMGGIAVLLDRQGDDSYHAALYAQGFGGPLGFGLLDDLNGADHYYAGGRWSDGYDDTPGYDGWSQGVGAGMRGSANGGIGTLLDGGGDDLYECDYFSHGGGYWFAVGIARDFGGNDQRIGATRLAYDGAARVSPPFLRWGLGWQAHYGLGFVIDDAGDDVYGGNIVGLGFSWDIGVAGLLDFAGSDQYKLTYGGQGQQAAIGIIFDSGGDDTYGGTDYGGAPADISYHPLPNCGGNFAFSINLGGQDTYGGERFSNTTLERGSPGGFLIDRD